MKILDIPQSGRCGTFVSVRTRYGQVRRRRGVIRKQPSAAQLATRARFGRVRALWRTLTQDQRNTWTPATEGVKSRARLGQSGRLSGYLLFVKVNVILATQGLPPVLTPPERPKFDTSPVGALVSTNTGGVAELKLAVTTTPSTDILVLAAAPCSAGVSFVNHYVIVGRLPAAEAGYSNITKLVVDRFGELRPGRKVFIRTRQVRNGWTDLPAQTTATIPIS